LLLFVLLSLYMRHEAAVCVCVCVCVYACIFVTSIVIVVNVSVVILIYMLQVLLLLLLLVLLSWYTRHEAALQCTQAWSQRWTIHRCQKRPIYMSKDTYLYVKRYLLICQKRPIYMSKWPIYKAKETYLQGKRDLKAPCNAHRHGVRGELSIADQKPQECRDVDAVLPAGWGGVIRWYLTNR